MDQHQILKRIRMARTFCAEQLPWFAPVLYACRIRLSTEVEIAAIAKDLRVFYNPYAVEQLWEANNPESALRKLGFIWAHEIAHILREHHMRARTVNAKHKLWNLAADLEINDADWPGLEAPLLFQPCLPHQFSLPNGLLAEQYYKRLKDMPEEDVAEWINEEGSGVHGQETVWEKEDDYSERNEEVDSMEVELLREKSKIMLNEAYEQGKLHLGLARWVRQAKDAKVNWRNILTKLIRQCCVKWEAGRHDYSWRRPHRRQHIHTPFVIPALAGRPVPMCVACIVDTSGSIQDASLSCILAEVEKIMTTLNCEALVVPCDAVAYPHIELKDRRGLRKINRLQGGGGTNMVVGVEAALALKPAVAMVVVFTDGHTPFPPQRYATPVIWALMEKGNIRAPEPPKEVWPKECVVRVRW